LCLVNADDTDTLFEKTFRYQPDYFPKGMGEVTIRLMESARNWLTLVFDSGRQGQTQDFEQLSLTIEFQPCQTAATRHGQALDWQFSFPDSDHSPQRNIRL
jgi:hypothetical protein